MGSYNEELTPSSE